MKRARKKGTKNPPVKKELSGYKSDMLDLGYDPDAADDTADDTAENPAGTKIAPEDDFEEENTAPETEIFSDENPPEETAEGETFFENDGEPEDSFGEASPKKRRSGKKPLIFTVSLITIILIFVAALGFGGFMNEEEEPVDENYTVPVDKGTGKINILVLGADKDGLRTDTMILASYDMDVNSVKLLSIPRDTRMYIGNKYQKINAAHAISENGKIKGAQGSIEAVTRLTAIPVNYYIEFSFDAFKKTVDALGGIDFDVPQNMNYDDPAQDLHIHLTKGYQHLDGDKAEQFVRFRSYPMGDIARVEAQQAFIKAVAEQKLNAGIIASIPDLYSVLKEEITTNFTLSDVIKYANNLAELSPESITMFQLPGAFGGGEYTTSYWIANMEEVKALVETEFGYDAANATIDSYDGASKSKDSADRRKTSSPTQAKTAKPTASSKTPAPSATSKATEQPAETKKPTEKPSSAQPEKTHTSEKTPEPAHTQTPATTKEPEKTASPTAEPTERPARPTPNPDNE